MGRSAYLCYTVTTPSAQRDAMLEFVLLAAQEEGPRPFPETVLDVLRRVVRCDTLAYRAWNQNQAMVDQ
jgi:hypothetical protein